MAVPVAFMAAGTAMQVFGQYKANMDQAKAELANADFYRTQALFAKDAEFRQADIAAKNYEFTRGAQVSAYAKGGVDLSGSAAGVVAQTMADKVSELNAIKQKGDLDYRLAISRAHQSEAQAATLQDPYYNFMQASGTVLTNTAKGVDNGRAPSLTGAASTSDGASTFDTYGGGGARPTRAT